MKHFILLLTFAAFTNMGNAQTCITDSVFNEFGNLIAIYEFDSINDRLCGLEMRFYANGFTKEEGYNAPVDSVLCKDCYEVDYQDSLNRLKPYSFAHRRRTIKVGLWKYYHENGTIKEKGHYCSSVHESSTSRQEKDGDVILLFSGYSVVDLKDGDWEYFDETGKRTHIETYVCGALTHTTFF